MCKILTLSMRIKSRQVLKTCLKLIPILLDMHLQFVPSWNTLQCMSLYGMTLLDIGTLSVKEF